MSCRTTSSRRGRGAFTLLEVMLAVVIIAFMMFSVYRFVRTDLLAIRISSQVSFDRASTSALVEYVRTQLEDLPARGQGLLLGNPGSINSQASDELQWLCRAGAGVLTSWAPAEYRVTLAIQPVAKSGSELEIGLRRSATNEDEKNYSWVSLLRPAAGLEVRYFDPRLNNWVARWSDANMRPSLVRLRIWRSANEPPLESVLPVPSARSQGGLTR